MFIIGRVHDQSWWPISANRLACQKSTQKKISLAMPIGKFQIFSTTVNQTANAQVINPRSSVIEKGVDCNHEPVSNATEPMVNRMRKILFVFLCIQHSREKKLEKHFANKKLILLP